MNPLPSLSPTTVERIQRGLRYFDQRQTIAAQIASQPGIAIGDERPFHSTAVGRPDHRPRLCHYTGQTVTVIGVSWAVGMPGFEPADDETVFTVRASDGIRFDAFAGELNGWYERTGQYVLPDGSYYLPSEI
jgi:hypothetical protein